MDIVVFDYNARFGHFLRAEANANAPTYPVPPRTVLLGLVGAVLGLQKDEPQEILADAQLAVSGLVPRTFWHKTNLRKDPPAPLSWRVKATDKGSSAAQKNTIHPQEWLWHPTYRIWAGLPEPYHTELADRLCSRRWHYSPCMGLSEMLADLRYAQILRAERLDKGTHRVASVVRDAGVRVDTSAACADGLAIQTLRMPRAATPDRIFTHERYFVERHAKPIPVETADAWDVGGNAVMFL